MDFMVFQYPMITVQACLDGILLGILFALMNLVIFLEPTKIVREELFLKIGIPIQILHGTTLLLKEFEDPLQFFHLDQSR